MKKGLKSIKQMQYMDPIWIKIQTHQLLKQVYKTVGKIWKLTRLFDDMKEFMLFKMW